MDYIRGGRVFNSLSKISSNDAGSPAAAGWSPGSAIPHAAVSHPGTCAAAPPRAVFASEQHN